MNNPHMLINHLSEQLAEHLKGIPRQIIVAYSGGVDSHVLLHALADIRHSYPQHDYSAIYIHHGLSENADKWQQHCAQVCENLAFEFSAARVEVNKSSRQSLEALARDARYGKLTQMASDNALVLVAQHQDDQLETFLLQLKRGAGPKGLSAMPVIQSGERNIQFLRPLLQVSRAQIVAYAEQHNLQWQEDESNQNIDFDRNFLRQEILPALNQRWPEMAKSVARSAALCGEQQLLLDEVARQRLETVKASSGSLDISGLLKYSDPWIYQIVRCWLADLNLINPSQAILHQLRPSLLEAREDANPILRWQNWQFRRFDNKLYVVPVFASLNDYSVNLVCEKSVTLPDAAGVLRLSKDMHKGAVAIYIATGESSLQLSFGGFSRLFKPVDGKFSKPLKQWFKLWQIPPWHRERSVMLNIADELVGLVCEGKIILAENSADRSYQLLYLSYSKQ